MSDVGDKKQVKRRRTDLKFANKRVINGARLALGNPDISRFLWHVLERCGIFNTMSHLPPHEMAIASGNKDIGLHLIATLLQADPNWYTILMTVAGETTAKDEPENAAD